MFLFSYICNPIVVSFSLFKIQLNIKNTFKQFFNQYIQLITFQAVYGFCRTAGFCCLSKANYSSCFLLCKNLGKLWPEEKTSQFFLMDFYAHTPVNPAKAWSSIHTNKAYPTCVVLQPISKFSGDHTWFFLFLAETRLNWANSSLNLEG